MQGVGDLGSWSGTRDIEVKTMTGQCRGKRERVVHVLWECPVTYMTALTYFVGGEGGMSFEQF